MGAEAGAEEFGIGMDRIVRLCLQREEGNFWKHFPAINILEEGLPRKGLVRVKPNRGGLVGKGLAIQA